MAIDPKNHAMIGGVVAALVILLLLVWAVMASSRASKAEAKVAELSQTASENDTALKEQKHLLDAAEALTDKRTKERDAYDAERKELRKQIDDAQRLLKQNADLATEAEQKCQKAELASQMAEEARAKVVKDRDHQYAQWRQTQDRYDDLLKSYNQLKQQVADGGGNK